jgi:WD40 domain-containing protein/PEGA domain-containing protein
MVVTVDEPDALVQVLNEGGKLEITRKGEKGPITISVDPGKHRLKVEKDGFEFFAKEFEVQSGGKLAIASKLIPLKEQPVVAGAKKSPPHDKPPPDVQPTAATTAVLGAPDWPPGPGDPQFPGLVPRPFVLPGVHRWQMASRFPRAMLENVAWSPDGQRVACCGIDELIRIYDVKTLQLVRAWPASKVMTVVWSRDGKLIAGGSYDWMLQVWNAGDGSPRLNFKSHAGADMAIQSVAFSPDSQKIATACMADRTVRHWNSTNGERGQFFRTPSPRGT